MHTEPDGKRTEASERSGKQESPRLAGPSLNAPRGGGRTRYTTWETTRLGFACQRFHAAPCERRDSQAAAARGPCSRRIWHISIGGQAS